MPEPGAGRPPAAHPGRWRASWSHLLEASVDAGVGRDLPARGWVFDIVVALAFTGVGSAFLPVFYPAANSVDFLFVSLVNLPLMLRRGLPKISFVLVLVAGLAQIAVYSPIGIHDAGLLFSLYSLAGYTNRRVGLAGFAAMVVAALAGAVTYWWDFIDERLIHGQGNPLVHVLTTVGMILLALATWASGERLRSSRIGMVALADRAATLERERTQQARLAAIAERARIAREMHDVIAHGLSVMIAQADGAAYVIDDSPAAAKQALDRISRTGRSALTQMRGLLGLLRAGDLAGPQVGPQPGLAQLGELLAEASDLGLEVEVHRSGEPPALAAMTQLTLYRIVQEGLTNARKHGGDRVVVRIDYGEDRVELVVANAPAEPGKLMQTQEPGHGLTGMAERVSAIGGSLSSGFSDDGSFSIVATIPYTRGSLT